MPKSCRTYNTRSTMNGISKLAFIAATLLATALGSIVAQAQDENQYQRASLYNMMVRRPNLQYSKEIELIFGRIEKPERFNDHSLGVKTFLLADLDNMERALNSFVDKSQIGKRMVARWFNRDKATGSFNVDLVTERGLYNATLLDVNLANAQTRNMAILADAGENLIGKTFLAISDIYYVDKSNRWSIAKDLTKLSTNIVSGVQQTIARGEAALSTGPITDAELLQSNELSWLTDDLMGNMKGFKVHIATYLFQLEWDDEIAGLFYNQYYFDASAPNAAKAEAFTQSKGEFRLRFVGMVENTSSNTALSGVITNLDMIRKVCTRALDKNLSDLQHKFEDFRIKAPLFNTAPLQCAIGMKEDITEKSRFEVLEVIEQEDGTRKYQRVGVIKPVAGHIWDNRYMADLEAGNPDALLKATTFEKVSGGDFMPGMLIREIK